MSTPMELLRDRKTPTPPSADGQVQSPASQAEPLAKATDAVASAAANPYSSASLVPMLVAGLVLIVIAMIVAAAIS